MHGKRYYLCVKCKGVFKWGRYWIEKPWHCGRPMKFLTDKEARERIEGISKARRMKSKVDGNPASSSLHRLIELRRHHRRTRLSK